MKRIIFAVLVICCCTSMAQSKKIRTSIYEADSLIFKICLVDSLYSRSDTLVCDFTIINNSTRKILIPHSFLDKEISVPPQYQFGIDFGLEVFFSSDPLLYKVFPQFLLVDKMISRKISFAINDLFTEKMKEDINYFDMMIESGYMFYSDWSAKLLEKDEKMRNYPDSDEFLKFLTVYHDVVVGPLRFLVQNK